MAKYLQKGYVLLIIFFIFATIIPGLNGRGAQAEDGLGSLQHINAQILNDYLAAMIKNKEPEIKAAVVNGVDITDFKLNDASFDINTGKILIKFTVEYKNSDVTGALGFEVRVSDDASQKIGGYCLGLEGGLHSSKIITDTILVFTRNHINKSLVGKEFWSDNQPHSQYGIFKNENLTYIANKALIASSAADNQFKKATIEIPGGVLQVEFKNPACSSFDLHLGQAQVKSNLAANLKTDFGENFNSPNAGKMEAYFDFYINPVDKSWWAKLNKFKLNINIAPQFNSLIQELVDQELHNRQVLIPLDMPKG